MTAALFIMVFGGGVLLGGLGLGIAVLWAVFVVADSMELSTGALGAAAIFSAVFVIAGIALIVAGVNERRSAKAMQALERGP